MTGILFWLLSRPAQVSSSPAATALEEPGTLPQPDPGDPPALGATVDAAGSAHPLPATPSEHRERRSNAPIANGVVVYSGTGQGVPWLDLHAEGLALDQDGATATAVDGTFRIALRGDSPTRVRFLDEAAHFEEPVTFDPKSGAIADVRIPVLLGPTYVLKIQSEQKLDTSSLTARLVVGEPSFRTQWEALRTGDAPWVRFNALVPKEPRSSAGAALAVSTRDGLYKGRVSVPGTQGFFPEAMRVELRAVGALSGRIVLPPDCAQVAVRLELDGTSTPGLPIDRCSPADKLPSAADETYRFAGLEPGHYRVTAYAEGFHPLVAEVDVLPGEVTRLDIDLNAPAETGTIHGRVLSGYGNVWRRPPIVRLVSRATGRKVARTRLALQDPPLPAGTDAPRGSFVLRNVPYGTYSISVLDSSREDGTAREIWDSIEVEVDRREVSVELRYAPAPCYGPSTFEVRDARTHRVVSSFDLVVFTVIRNQDTGTLFNPLFAMVDRLSGRPALTTFTRARLRWMIATDDYAPAWGDESALEWPSLIGPSKVCVVELERGWGGMAIVYREMPGGTPMVMQDVAIVLDGQEKTRTDADGLAFLSESTTPQFIGVAKFGYHIVQALGAADGRPKPHARTFCFLIAPD